MKRTSSSAVILLIPRYHREAGAVPDESEGTEVGSDDIALILSEIGGLKGGGHSGGVC